MDGTHIDASWPRETIREVIERIAREGGGPIVLSPGTFRFEDLASAVTAGFQLRGAYNTSRTHG